MSLRDNFLIFLSFFPVFIFRSNFTINEIFFILILIIFLFLILILFNNNLKKKKSYNIQILFFCFVITYGIDNHLGLYNGLIAPYIDDLKFFKIIYIPAAILLIIIFLINLFLLKYFKDEKKIFTIIFVFIFTLFIFNIFDSSKSFKKIPNVSEATGLKYASSDLILILDEMSGLNSLESKTFSGKEFVNLAENFFKKNNFEYYPNAYSISDNSISAITSMVNFKKSFNKKDRKKYIKKSKNYFIEFDLIESKLFEKFESISVFQNMHINYCQLPNVIKCHQFNPFNSDEFLIGFKDNFFTKYFSIWSLNGSVFGKFFWRLGKQIRLSDSLIEPEGQKASIIKTFKDIKYDVSSNKFDLIFVHILFPHIPFGLEKNCKYSGKLSNMNNFFSKDKKVELHNIERKCVLIFLDQFMKKLKNINNLRIILLSDHGSRIYNKPDSSNSIIFATKNITNDNFIKNNIKISSQEKFIDLYGKE